MSIVILFFLQSSPMDGARIQCTGSVQCKPISPDLCFWIPTRLLTPNLAFPQLDRLPDTTKKVKTT